MAMKSQTQRGLLIGLVASIASCGLVGVWCLLVGNFGSFEGKVLGTTATVAGASILGLASAIPWERRRWHPVGPFGMACVAIAFVLVVVAIWSEPWRWNDRVLSHNFERALGIACVAGVAFPHIGLMSLARLRRDYRWIRFCTLTAVALLAIQIDITILLEPNDDAWFRFMGIVGIFVACGTVAVPILHRVSAIKKREAVKTVELALSMTCPRCELAQQLPAGRSKCSQCGLRFLIEIEEESCEQCGYPLYKLESATCPECGTPIVGE